MPYGKYRGKYIHELPSAYLLWIAENWSEDNPTDQFICMSAD
ncbi:MAG: putative quorum-sensing-regulated virulence factor, partial [Nitrosarchaeum sp.]